MAITFAVRGDSLDARYSTAGKTPARLGALAPPEVTTDEPGINGVNSIDLAGAFLTFRGLNYIGRENTPSVATRSVLIRVKFASLSSTMGLFYMGGSNRSETNGFGARVEATPEIRVYVANESGQIDNGITSSSGLGTTNWHDIVFTWDGTTSANGLKVYVDGVEKLSDTMSRSLPTYDTNQQNACSNIVIGPCSPGAAQNVHFYVDEFVVWDEVIDPTSVTLTSGSGSLNGSSRSTYVEVDALDAKNNTFPTEVQVESGVTWIQQGVEKTGTLSTPTLPDENDVRLGVEYGQSADLKTGALNTNTSNAYEVEVGDNEVEVKVRTNG